MSVSNSLPNRCSEKIESIRIHNFTQHSTRIVLVHAKGKNDLMLGARTSRAVLCPVGWFDIRVYNHSHEKSYVSECRSVHTVCKNLIIRTGNFGKGAKDHKSEPRIFLGYNSDKIVEEDEEMKIESAPEKAVTKTKEKTTSNGAEKISNSDVMELCQTEKEQSDEVTV